ncbi:sensor histidine kinase [Flexithrix dorotheae]|uniref:sensor histidine kinase n=1 Tax=Flexithrix dorotheae TaxID=70993 RepID=UPI0003602639|nr:sensor histidine kinase [Flexithrix dorotheae]
MILGRNVLPFVYRVSQHILFWMTSFLGFAHLFKIGDTVQKIDYIFAGFFHVSLILGVYINLLFLIPKIFQKGKYLAYGVFIIFTIIGMNLLHYYVFNSLIDRLLPGYFIISFFDQIDILIFITAYLLTSSLLKISRGWFKLQEIKHQLVRAEKEKYQIQLDALRTQINPHFLFNSLNVLHSLALKKSEKSADAVIDLADILRYVIYDSNRSKIKVSQEVKLIEDYISLQKYRIEESSRIEFTEKVEKDNELAPMLFLPLIENSFKHGIKGDLNQTYVKINLKSDGTCTSFEIENNKGKAEEINDTENKGIGIQNIRARLKLIYPGKHRFEVNETAEVFKVQLFIDHEN